MSDREQMSNESSIAANTNTSFPNILDLSQGGSQTEVVKHLLARGRRVDSEIR